MILEKWYLELEVHIGTTDFEYLIRNFKVTFKFEDDAPLVDTTLQIMKNKIFKSKESRIPVPLCSTPWYSLIIQEV